MEILGIAASALIAADRAAQVRASNIVNAITPDYTRQDPVFSPIVSGGGVAVFTQDVNSPVNLIGETLGLMMAANQYKAAASLVRTGNELSATLLQTFA